MVVGRIRQYKARQVHVYISNHLINRGNSNLACIHVHVHVRICICWLLFSNQNFKGPYLKAKVVEEIVGWLG